MPFARPPSDPIASTGPALAPARLGGAHHSDTPPRLLDALIARPAIARQLAQGRGCVTLLCAPPGSGKTTALLQHYRQLQGQSDRVCWIALSSADNDARQLHAHLLRALPHSPAHTPEPAHAAPLLFPEHTHVLLDGMELLHEPAARSLAEQFLLSLPESSSACATLHQIQGPVLQEARLRGIVQVMDASSLRLSDAEAQALLGEPWTREQVSSLNQRMQGWAAGLRLLQRAPEATYHWLHDTTGQRPLPDAVTAYFEDLLRSHLSPQGLQALMQLSTFERFRPEMFTAMPAPPCEWDVVEQLLRWGWFLQAEAQSPPWIRFHPALGQYLCQRLQRYAPARYQELRHFAACWFAEHGHAEDAVRHAVQLPHVLQAAHIIEQAGAITVDLGAGPDVVFSQALPPERAAELPLLFLGQVYYRFRHGRLQEARRMFDAACALTADFTQITVAHQHDEVLGWARTLRCVLLTTEDRPIPACHVHALEQEYAHQAGRNPILAVAIASVLAFIWLDEGRYTQAATICSRGLRLHAPESTAKVRLFLHMHQANAAVAIGSLTDAQTCLAQARHLAQLQLSPHSYEMHTLQLLQALVDFERNDTESAWQLLQPALRHIPSVYGWSRLYMEVFSMAARLMAQREDPTALEHLLREAEQLARERQLPRLIDYLHVLRLRELTLACAWAQARELLHSPALHAVLQPPADTPFAHTTQVPALLVAAQLELDLGKVAVAQDWLQQLPEAWEQTADQRLRFHAQVLLARTAYALRRYKAAATALYTAVEIACTAGLVQRLWQERQHITQLSEALRRTRHSTLTPSMQHWLHSTLRTITEVAPAAQALTHPTPRPVQTESQRGQLSPRESEILALMAEGCINKEIAAQLGISEGTVKTHRKHIHEKLGVRSRSQAIQKAREWLLL